MKRIKNILGLLMLCMLCSISFASCKDDDDPGDTSAVAGTWRGDDYDHFYSNVTITFNSDGTGSATIDHNGTFTSIRRAQFTYKVKGSKVTTKGTMAVANSDGETRTDDFNNTYELKGNTLHVTGGSKWYTSSVYSYRK